MASSEPQSQAVKGGPSPTLKIACESLLEREACGAREEWQLWPYQGLQGSFEGLYRPILRNTVHPVTSVTRLLAATETLELFMWYLLWRFAWALI